MFKSKDRVIEYVAVNGESQREIRSIRERTSTYKGKNVLEFNEDKSDWKSSLTIKNCSTSYTS